MKPVLSLFDPGLWNHERDANRLRRTGSEEKRRDHGENASEDIPERWASAVSPYQVLG